MPDKLLNLKLDIVFQELFGNPKNAEITGHLLSLILKREVLPAPFTPTRPTFSPLLTSKDREENTVSSPKLSVKFCALKTIISISVSF